MAAAPLHVVPLRPVACGSLLWQMGGITRVSVFVKATFALVHEGTAQLATPADLVTSDRLAPPTSRADAAPAESLAMAAETAPYLPSAGVVLVGAAHAPLGIPTPAMAVRLAIYSGDRPMLEKILHVFGDRTTAAPTPRAMKSMPLVYERAFGGAGVDDNPVGVGAALSGALPNIVDPVDARRPAGLGPLAPGWAPRRRLLGGAERPRVENGVVALPDDLDFRYFHAAPADQQIELLGGDEWIVLDGVDPELPRLRSRLPSARGEARCQVLSGSGGGGGVLRAIDLAADLLVIDAERRSCSVVWRGHIPIDSAEGAARMRVFAGVELPGFPIPWPDRPTVSVPPAVAKPLPKIEYPDDSGEKTAQVIGPVKTRTLPFPGRGRSTLVDPVAAPPPTYGLPFKPKAPDEAPRFVVDEDSHTTAVSLEELRSKLDEVAPFKLAAPGAPAAAAPKDIPGAPWSHAQAAKPPESDEDQTVGVRVPPPDLLNRMIAARQAAAAAPPAVIAPPPIAPSEPASPWARGQRAPSADPPPPARASQSGLEVAPPAPAPAAEPQRPSAPLPAVPAVVAPHSAAAASNAAASVDETEDTPPAELPEPTDPGRAEVLDRIRRGEPLDGLDAPKADLSGLDLTGRSLLRARLRGANLKGARLARTCFRGADLARADLGSADLSEADLAGADLSGATLVDARLEGAKLDDANLSGAHARGASLEGATGERVNLSGADLEGANLRRVELPGVDLRGAKLAGARCDSAGLPGAQLGDVTGDAASFDGARLSRARCSGAQMSRATFRNADLSASVWERAKLPGATFEGANLRGANLQRAALANAHFDGADLSEAELQRMNAEHADFRAASLDGADLRKVQAPEACFAEVAMHRANAEKANFGKASFAGADLRGSSFRAAILTGANCAFARLEGTDLRDADLANAVLRGASRDGAKMTGANLAGADEGTPEPEQRAPKA